MTIEDFRKAEQIQVDIRYLEELLAFVDTTTGIELFSGSKSLRNVITDSETLAGNAQNAVVRVAKQGLIHSITYRLAELKVEFKNL